MQKFNQQLDHVIDQAIGKRIVGCVVLIRQNGEEIYAKVAGYADREAKRNMARNAIFRLASVTKPIVATAILHMAELGLLNLDDPVTKTLPWFTPQAPDGSTPPILVRHLLTHTSGITYDLPPDIASGLSGPLITLEENLRRLAKQPLIFKPGTGWAYGMSIDVLGGIITAINQSSLDEAIQKYICKPLAMLDTRFGVTDQARLATPYADGATPKRMGEPEMVADDLGLVEFSPRRIFEADAPQSGGAGMAGTADDVMQMLDIFHRSNPILKPAILSAALANQIGDIKRRPSDAGKGFSFIGAVIKDRQLANSPCPNCTVDWGGAWGHHWVIDPTNKITIVVCTNTAFEGCMGPFRDQIRDAIYKSPSA